MKSFFSLLVLFNFLCSPSIAQEAQVTEELRQPSSNQMQLDDVIKKALSLVVDKTSQTKGRVAIMDFPSLETGGLTGLSSYIANKAGNQVINAGRQVVDRGALEKIISEQKLQQNALMDAATAAKVGKLAGAGLFIIGNYSVLSKKFVLTVRALSVETGQFVAAAEETIPMHDELRAEITELHGKSGVASSTANLESSNSEVPASDADREQAQREVKFDIELCKKIRPGMEAAEIFGMAVKQGVIEPPSERLDGNTCKDSAGEDSSGGCFTVSSWTLSVDGFNIWASDIAKARKGKTPEGKRKVLAWSYSGPSNLPGLENCAPNGDEWNEKRVGSSKSSKKK